MNKITFDMNLSYRCYAVMVVKGDTKPVPCGHTWRAPAGQVCCPNCGFYNFRSDLEPRPTPPDWAEKNLLKKFSPLPGKAGIRECGRTRPKTKHNNTTKRGKV